VSIGKWGRPNGPSWGFLSGLILLGCISVVYPVIANRAEHPLAIFVLPILVVAALGTPGQAGVVGGLAVMVALVEGAATSHLGTAPFAARIVVVAATAIAGVAVARVRSDRERSLREADHTGELMDTFQRALVPHPSPPPGIIVQTRYVPGEERLMLGGDFFDALDLPDGSLGFIVGDVCGHGPDAAALGAALRAGWKTIATHAVQSPPTWVRVMDLAFFSHARHDTYATVCTGRVGGDGLVQFVSCGHPWPILLGPEPTVIQPRVARPLGIRNVELDVAVTAFMLPADTAVLLYTDGLIENRLQPDTAAEEHLITYLRGNPSLDLDALLAEFGSDGFSDDVAVMTLSLES
jgi:serine phosphatase RsbU (regulator of sigma subunit)